MPFVIKLDRPFLFDYEKEWFQLINHVSVSYATWHAVVGKLWK